MAQYLIQVAYTSDAMATLVNSPQDRIAVVSKAIKKLGGKVVSGWMCLGEYDTALIAKLPDNTAAAAFPSPSTQAAPARASKPRLCSPSKKASPP